MTPRVLCISLIASIAIVFALSACATQEESEPAEAATAQCYWLSNEGAGWVARSDLSDAEMCFEMDSCSGGVGLSGGGCYKWANGTEAPATPWADLGFQPLSSEEQSDDEATEQASGAACYVQEGDSWRPSGWGESEGQCFRRDNCSGMGAEPDGPCFKWAMSADAPALPWSASLTNPRLGEDVPPPRDLYEGSYEMTSDCPEQGCAYGAARFSSNTPLYARQDARARIVATIPAAECVLKTGRDALLSAPRRGVVLETASPFVAGDVIYLTNYEGEGYSTVWRRGEYLEFQDEVVVRWDDGPTDPREGYWVEVTRANGQRGWAQSPEIAERDCAFARR